MSHRGPVAWGASKRRGQRPRIPSGHICQCVIACNHQAGLVNKLDERLGSQAETRRSASSAPATGGVCRPLGTHMSESQQLGRWRIQDQFWGKECLEPSSREIPMVCMLV